MGTALRAVIVDVDGTLYQQSSVRRYVARRMVRFGLLHPLAAWMEFRAVASYRRAQEKLRALGQPGGAWRQLEEAVRQSGYAEIFIRQSVERWMETVPMPSLEKARLPGLIPFLDWARAQGIRLGVVSDYEAGAKLRTLGIDKYFSVIVCAQDEEVGIFKPSPAGLLVASRRLGVRPEEALYVGDRVDVDGAAAVAAGMEAAVISSRTTGLPRGVVTVEDWFQLLPLVQDRIRSMTVAAG